ncbi:hypothetical protein GQ43DRAFT_424280 [Delitschia confertaspora ATCC 74209]|uniref:Rhodopsin domain-containing protein n=1 Tax=Delitschia confertaspora ATCC 74209 TaxID=1513339 RepID=A0A9P4JJ05_9PLEO|nr:hypothetical protein GQ43DRAFT_424280 [Delitschia confertaspora ATCC 74209]
MNPNLKYNDHGRILVIVLTVFLFLDYVVVGLRIYARHLMRRPLEINDWAIITGLGLLTALYGVELAVVIQGGVGLHQSWIYVNKGMPTLILAGKLVLTADILWNATIMVIKISILHLYLAIFGIVGGKFRRAVYATIALTMICGTAFIIEELALCRPLAFFWDKTIPGGKCSDERLGYLIPGVVNMVVDIIIFGLPMPLLWSLKISTEKKIGTCVVFGIGLGICLIAGYRLRFVIELDYDDFTYSLWLFAIFGPIEPMLGIISACLPILPPVFGRSKAKTVPSTKNSSIPSASANSLGQTKKSWNSKNSRFDTMDDPEYPLIEVYPSRKERV